MILDERQHIRVLISSSSHYCLDTAGLESFTHFPTNASFDGKMRSLGTSDHCCALVHAPSPATLIYRSHHSLPKHVLACARDVAWVVMAKRANRYDHQDGQYFSTDSLSDFDLSLDR